MRSGKPGTTYALRSGMLHPLILPLLSPFPKNTLYYKHVIFIVLHHASSRVIARLFPGNAELQLGNSI